MEQKSNLKREAEAHRSEGLFEQGMGHLVVARFKAQNTVVEAGVFLLDIWCLGVKDAFFTVLPAAEYEDRLLGGIARNTPLERMEAGQGRALVESAVAYARDLGFAPHADYKAACRVFGGILPVNPPEKFKFGCDGKPHYIQGPHDSPARVAQVLRQLQGRCGEGGYHYTVVGGDFGDFE